MESVALQNVTTFPLICPRTGWVGTHRQGWDERRWGCRPPRRAPERTASLLNREGCFYDPAFSFHRFSNCILWQVPLSACVLLKKACFSRGEFNPVCFSLAPTPAIGEMRSPKQRVCKGRRNILFPYKPVRGCHGGDGRPPVGTFPSGSDTGSLTRRKQHQKH